MNSFPQSLLRALPRPSSAAGAAAAPQLAFIRHQSSSRRLTKRLQLPPHESFKLTASSPAKSHIVHNPPSTSPSVYATPTLFLPRDDPRRTLFAQTRPTAAEKQQAARLPPPLKRPHEKKYHLTPENFAEIRELRNSDPDKWTRSKLAAKFGTSQFFIGMVCEASVQRKEEMQGRLATIKRQWGKMKAAARLDRKRRKAGWGGADEQ